MNKPNIYAENGYRNRKDYLHGLSEEYCIPMNVVMDLATLLGPEEDFDALVTTLEDIEMGGWFAEDDWQLDD